LKNEVVLSDKEYKIIHWIQTISFSLFLHMMIIFLFYRFFNPGDNNLDTSFQKWGYGVAISVLIAAIASILYLGNKENKLKNSTANHLVNCLISLCLVVLPPIIYFLYYKELVPDFLFEIFPFSLINFLLLSISFIGLIIFFKTLGLDKHSTVKKADTILLRFMLIPIPIYVLIAMLVYVLSNGLVWMSTLLIVLCLIPIIIYHQVFCQYVNTKTTVLNIFYTIIKIATTCFLLVFIFSICETIRNFSYENIDMLSMLNRHIPNLSFLPEAILLIITTLSTVSLTILTLFLRPNLGKDDLDYEKSNYRILNLYTEMGKKFVKIFKKSDAEMFSYGYWIVFLSAISYILIIPLLVFDSLLLAIIVTILLSIEFFKTITLLLKLNHETNMEKEFSNIIDFKLMYLDESNRHYIQFFLSKIVTISNHKEFIAAIYPKEKNSNRRVDKDGDTHPIVLSIFKSFERLKLFILSPKNHTDHLIRIEIKENHTTSLQQIVEMYAKHLLILCEDNSDLYDPVVTFLFEKMIDSNDYNSVKNIISADGFKLFIPTIKKNAEEIKNIKLVKLEECNNNTEKENLIEVYVFESNLLRFKNEIQLKIKFKNNSTKTISNICFKFDKSGENNNGEVCINGPIKKGKTKKDKFFLGYSKVDDKPFLDTYDLIEVNVEYVDGTVETMKMGYIK